MHPVILDLGYVKIYSWGLMLAIAVSLAIWGVSRRLAQEGYDSEMAIDMVIIMIVAGIAGARLGYVIVYRWNEFLNDPAYLFALTDGSISGLMWYGGFAGGFLAFLFYILKRRLNFWNIADILAPFAALGYAIVRIGCFLNGCCYGKVSHSVFTVVFPYLDDLPRYPTQIFSSAINLLIFGLLLWYYPQRRFSGEVFIIYLLSYSVYRFTIEFFRASEVMYGFLSPGQLFSLFIFAAGLILYFWRQNKDMVKIKEG